MRNEKGQFVGKPKVTKACKNCGKLFTRLYCKIKDCCSKQCGLDYYFNSHRGKNHPHWQGNRTSNKNMRTRFWREIRNEVLKRDSYTCQLCGSNENLHVDHIQKWEAYIDMRFNIDNCRTVCMACHYKITFGKPMPKRVKKWGWFTKTKKERIDL